MVIPFSPDIYYHPISGKAPSIWYGTVARDGDAAPWKDVAIGSIYIANVSGTVTYWEKDADNKADADWGYLSLTT